MHVLIATTGALSPEPVAEFAERLLGDKGTVSVITVIEVPRSFLDTIRSDQWHPLADGKLTWPTQEDAVIARYVEERGHKLTEPILTALRARAVEPTVMYLEGEDPAQTIIDAAERADADVVVVGATRPIFDEASWESVSVRVMRELNRPVLVVPAAARIEGEPEDDLER
ncbi:MAG: universal stress protein [Acidimicrobiia bacterium]